MSVLRRGRFETVHHDEGVVSTRSGSGIFIQLPSPMSANHQLRVAAVLWSLWSAARVEGADEEVRWMVQASDVHELTLPLISILSAIDAELRRTGHTLILTGVPATLLKTGGRG